MPAKPKVAIESIDLINPDSLNVIIGQSHFIKTVEDMHEALVSTVPGIKFGLAFSEASGKRIVRGTGTDDALQDLATENAMRISCGHIFVIFLGNAFPINVLHALRRTPELVTVFCATANPVQVIVAKSAQGGGIMGVIDGGPPSAVETDTDRAYRIGFLRKIGYKIAESG
jgi:uncharacterized protein